MGRWRALLPSVSRQRGRVRLQWHRVCGRGAAVLFTAGAEGPCATAGAGYLRAHTSALREGFQRPEECNGSEQRRCTWPLTTPCHSPVQYDTVVFFLFWGTSGDPPPPPGGGDAKGGDGQLGGREGDCWPDAPFGGGVCMGRLGVGGSRGNFGGGGGRPGGASWGRGRGVGGYVTDPWDAAHPGKLSNCTRQRARACPRSTLPVLWYWVFFPFPTTTF